MQVTSQALQKVRKGMGEKISFQTNSEHLQGLCRLVVACACRPLQLVVVQSSDGEVCHGRCLLEVDDASVLTVVGHNGDPDLQLLCIQMHRAKLYHNGPFHRLHCFQPIASVHFCVELLLSCYCYGDTAVCAGHSSIHSGRMTG